MTPNYTSFIKSIGKLAKSKSLFFVFPSGSTNMQQNNCTGDEIKPRKYRWSRRGREHLCKIYSTVSESWKTIPFSKALSRTIDKCILCSLPKNTPKYYQMKQGRNYNGILSNCRLVTNRTECIQAEISEANAALCALTETWIKEDDDITPLQVCPSGYKYISIPRKVRSGGGLALIYHNSINLKRDKEYSFNTMECAYFSIKLPSKTIHLGLKYRPPDGSVLQLCQELTTYLENNINTTGDTLLIGDLNIHINDPENQYTIIFEDTIKSLGLSNQVSFPTHRLQNTLDTIITAEDSDIISDTLQTIILSTTH